MPAAGVKTGVAAATADVLAGSPLMPKMLPDAAGCGVWNITCRDGPVTNLSRGGAATVSLLAAAVSKRLCSALPWHGKQIRVVMFLQLDRSGMQCAPKNICHTIRFTITARSAMLPASGLSIKLHCCSEVIVLFVHHWLDTCLLVAQK